MQSKNQISAVFDTADLRKKIGKVDEVLRATFTKDIPSEVFRDLHCLLSNILVSYDGSAVATNGADKIFIRLDFGDGFERLIAALRTGKLDVIHDCCTSFTASASRVAT
jgi:hypothetical protein